MKRFLVCLLSVLFLVGCGSPKEKKAKFEGVQEQKNYIVEGFKYLEEGDVARAIRSFDEAIKQDPANADNYIVLGQVYMRLKNFERSVDTFTAATRIAPNNGEAYYLLSTSLALAGRFKDALPMAQKSADIFYQSQDETNLKKAVVLVQSLSQQKEELEKQGRTQP